jgi:hypothetical protein
MNEPVVSLEAMDRLADMERDKALEKILRKHGFTGTDLHYLEKDGEQRLFISKKAFAYMAAHKNTMQSEIQKALDSALVKVLEAGLTIIELQKTGGKV